MFQRESQREKWIKERKSQRLNSLLLLSLLDDLLLEDGWLGETESDLVGGELVIAVGDGIKLSLHELSIEWVKVDSLVSMSINGDSHWSSGEVGWEALYQENKLVNAFKKSIKFS